MLISGEFCCDDCAYCRWNDIDGESYTNYQTQDQATIAVDLSSHLWANKLIEHLAWVEREWKSSNWRWQEWVCVRFFSGRSNFVFLCIVCWDNIHLDPDIAIVLHLTFVVLRVHWKPESWIIFPLKCNTRCLLHISLVVFFVDSKWTVRDLGVFKCLLKINDRASNDIVRFKEISVISLQVESVVFSWTLFSKQ